MTDYHTSFDPKSYLAFYDIIKVNEDEKGIVEFYMKTFHKFWSNFQSGSSNNAVRVRCLEYGGGPSVANLVSAAPKVDRIVFAEYTDANRRAVTSWIAGSPEAHDWSTFIKFVLAEVEGNTMDEDVSGREEELKRKLKSVVPCDVTKEPIVDLESVDIGMPFDVVSTSLCLEACVSSEEQYKSAVAKLCKFLKPNGYICMYGVLKETFYKVGTETFYTFPLTQNIVEEAMKEGGIEDIKLELLEVSLESGVGNAQSTFFAFGRKSATAIAQDIT